ncbi:MULTISPECIES: hypothetical protein [Methanosphaera]|uniref:hypothetical protein n=1 Tax=Methanosphaera TaxID=2316 RepID=UPI0011801F6D|nr:MULTISPECIES: hypothetical protein [Methanosphaera]
MFLYSYISFISLFDKLSENIFCHSPIVKLLYKYLFLALVPSCAFVRVKLVLSSRNSRPQFGQL